MAIVYSKKKSDIHYPLKNYWMNFTDCICQSGGCGSPHAFCEWYLGDFVNIYSYAAENHNYSISTAPYEDGFCIYTAGNSYQYQGCSIVKIKADWLFFKKKGLVYLDIFANKYGYGGIFNLTDGTNTVTLARTNYVGYPCCQAYDLQINGYLDYCFDYATKCFSYDPSIVTPVSCGLTINASVDLSSFNLQNTYIYVSGGGDRVGGHCYWGCAKITMKYGYYSDPIFEKTKCYYCKFYS